MSEPITDNDYRRVWNAFVRAQDALSRYSVKYENLWFLHQAVCDRAWELKRENAALRERLRMNGIQLPKMEESK